LPSLDGRKIRTLKEAIAQAAVVSVSQPATA
jgi:hypothetical protein